jgi:menaquinone-dependent protoporphyrinogen IX oxidase
MKYVLVYWSRYGNNKKLMETLADMLREKPAEVDVFTTGEIDPAAMPIADVYVFSAPTEAFRIQKHMRRFLKKLQGMEGKKYGVINTHGMKRNWLRSMEKMLKKKKMEKLAAVDFRVGEVAEDTLGLMDDWETHLAGFAASLQA